MGRNFRGISKLIPGKVAFRVGGISVIFCIFFYLCVIIVVLRAGKIALMLSGPGIADKTAFAGMIISVLLLYIGGTLLPLIRCKYETKDSRFARRFSANKTAVAGLVVILSFLLTAVFSPVIAPYDPVAQQNTPEARFAKPSSEHLMGTDKFGRDIFSRVVYGARVSLSIGIVAVLISSLLGIVIGAISGYSGGIVDEILMRLTDGVLAFPRLLIVLLLVAFFSNSFLLLVMVIGSTSWMGVARLVRAEVLSLKGKEFIQAAVAAGISKLRIIWRHMLPNALGPVIVAASLQIGTVILLESTLSFLGLGIQPPTPSWGKMVFDGREALVSAWWVSAFPGIAIALAVIACNLLGDGLRDALEPREAGI